MSTSSVKERALYFIKYKGLTMKEFESLADLSTGYITSMRKSFGEQKLSNVLKAFPELNRDWLLYGEGEMLKSTSTEDNNASFVAPYIKDELIYLPLFSVPALASFADNLSQASATLETYPVYVAKGEAYTKERHIVIEAKGESMSPTIQNKAMILCEKIEPEQWDYIQNEKIIAIIYDNSFTIKRVLRNNLATANTITLSADNTKYGTLEVSRCDIKGIYRAIKKVSEYL